MEEKDKYFHLRDILRFTEDTNKDDLVVFKKDKTFGPIVRMMELIKRLDKKKDQIDKIQKSIEKIENKLVPLIQQVIIIYNELAMSEISRQESFAEFLTEKYNTYIKGYPELEASYDGIIPTPDKCVSLFGTKFSEKNDEIGEIKNGEFQPLNKKDIKSLVDKQNEKYFLRRYYPEESKHKYYFLLSIFVSNSECRLITISASDSIIKESYPLLSNEGIIG